ncbi:hypothetical protein NADFUDRAFT_83531, partial [Nadsonia fulvescens var. elongata DSM 6958]
MSSFDTSLDASFHEEIMDTTPQDTYAPIPIDPSSHYEISPLLNQNDQVSVNFLIQSAMIESKGFKILSYQDIDPLKKQLILLKSRQTTIRHKLELESKVSDAASSLAKLHVNSTAVIDTNTNTTAPSSAFRRRSAAVSSLFTGNNTSNNKRLSKHAKDEYEISLKKMAELKDELATINERVNDIEIALLQHSVALLGWTHSGSITVKYARRDYDTVPATRKPVSKGAEIFNTMKHEGSLATMLDETFLPNTQKQNKYQPKSQHKNSESSIDPFQVDELISDISNIIDNEDVPISIKYDKEDMSLSIQDKLAYLVTICHHFFYNYRDIKQQLNEALENNKRTADNHQRGLEPTSDSELSRCQTEINNLRQLVQTTQTNLEMIEIENADLKSSQRDIDHHSHYEKEIFSLRKSLAETEDDLEKLELEHVDLKSSNKELNLQSQSHASRLKDMTDNKDEIIKEWKERHETLENELKFKSVSLEELIKQNADYESKHAEFNARITSLQEKIFRTNPGHNINQGDRFAELFLCKDSMINVSATILVREFKRIIEEMRTYHTKQLKDEEDKNFRLEEAARIGKVDRRAIH